MSFLKKMFEPGWRFVCGFCIIIVFGPLSILFPPFGLLVFFGGLLILYALDAKIPLWFETELFAHSPHCGEMVSYKAVRCKHYMFPLLPFIGVFLKIPYKTTYYKVCGKCLETHVGNNDFDTVLTIAAGGLATVEPITKKEFDAIIKKA